MTQQAKRSLLVSAITILGGVATAITIFSFVQKQDNQVQEHEIRIDVLEQGQREQLQELKDFRKEYREDQRELHRKLDRNNDRP